VLTGIAGGRDEPPTIVAAMEGLEGFDQGRTAVADDTGAVIAGLRALYRDHRQVGALGECYRMAAQMLTHPRQIPRAGAGIDHQTVVSIVQTVSDEIVENAALGVEHGAVQ